MILYVQRGNQNTLEGLHSSVNALFFSPELVWQCGAYVFCDKPEDVVNHFLFTHQRSGKALRLLYHCLALDFEYIRDRSRVEIITKAVLSLLSARFQVFAGILLLEGRYHAVFLINSVSIDGRLTFRDCNRTYLDLLRELEDLTDEEIKLSCADNVFFRNEDGNRENYIPYRSESG